jgi:hypothetical protein
MSSQQTDRIIEILAKISERLSEINDGLGYLTQYAFNTENIEEKLIGIKDALYEISAEQKEQTRLMKSSRSTTIRTRKKK